MSDKTIPVRRRGPARPLSIEQLETGLQLLGQGDLDHAAFWDANIVAFRRTVILAIRDTSDALLSSTMRPHWRVELENQLAVLIQYIELADRYVARRSFSPEPRSSGRPGASFRIH